MNKTWQVVLAFLVVFVAGGAIGAVFTLRYAPRPPEPAVQKGAPIRPEDFGPQLMRRWMQGNQLNLTPPQREKVRSIIFDTVEDLQRTRVETAHTDVLLLENMQDQIAAVLTPQQRNRFYELVQSQREKYARWTKEYQRRAMQEAQQDHAGVGGH